MSSVQQHWRDHAISASEVISDAFDVAKAYGAHVANWVLFFCLIANLIEMVNAQFEAFAGMAIVGIQSISLDVAGFGLTAMATSAKRRGDQKSAKKANVMGWTLISVMAITVGMVTLAAFNPEWAEGIKQANQVLMFVRVIVTVFYGHIVHQIREEGTAHENRLVELDREVSSLQKQLDSKTKELDTQGVQLQRVQSELQVSSLELSSLQKQLDSAQQRVSGLEAELNTGHLDTTEMYRELNTARVEVEGLRARLEAKSREVDMMTQDQAGVIEIRRELSAAHLNAEDLRMQLEAKSRELSSVQAQVSSLQRQVSTQGVQWTEKLDASGVQLDSKKASTGQKTGQPRHPQLDTGHPRVDTPAGHNIVQLDTHRKSGQEDIEVQIRALLQENPSLSARGIATQVGCSPTTAAKWKAAIIEQDTVVNE